MEPCIFERDYYAEMMDEMNTPLDPIEEADPGPMTEALHRKQVENHGCCASKGGARCGFARQTKPNSKQSKERK